MASEVNFSSWVLFFCIWYLLYIWSINGFLNIWLSDKVKGTPFSFSPSESPPLSILVQLLSSFWIPRSSATILISLFASSFLFRWGFDLSFVDVYVSRFFGEILIHCSSESFGNYSPREFRLSRWDLERASCVADNVLLSSFFKS